ncbi:hypothetical protein WJX73_004214 [Symbiochloris irregularis]|uniref:BZIP domain-containing protein n=1 Tax=Symbiochloris irregularis TaxID=706552 RepID=A0AAW1PZ27_9CHLO
MQVPTVSQDDLLGDEVLRSFLLPDGIPDFSAPAASNPLSPFHSSYLSADLREQRADSGLLPTDWWLQHDSGQLGQHQYDNQLRQTPLLSSNPLARYQPSRSQESASSSGAAAVGNDQQGDHRDESAPQESIGGAGEDDFDLQNASPSQSFRALDPNDPKQRARAAQKRFRTRQKERTRTQQKQLEELTGKMKELMQEKAALTTRNKILEAVVVLNTRHEKRLHANQEIMQREQCMLMGELAQFVNALEHRSDLKGSTVEQWTMGQYMDHVFPRYIARCKALLSKGGEAAQQEIDSLVCMRREMEDRKALFSCYYWALYCWNREERSSLEAVPPPPAIWQAILEGLKLSEQQEDFIVSARKEMIERLHEIADERRSILSSIAMLVVQSSPEVWQASLEMQQLQRSLGQERLAVHTFLFTVCQEVLTTQQEAFLDAAAYPWWPDILCWLEEQGSGSNAAW